MKNSVKRTTLVMSALIFSFQLCMAQTQTSATIPEERGVAKANNLSIAYERFGKENDRTIILIQGTGAQMILWPDKLCRELAGKGYSVIRFDNRDIGLSSKLDTLGMPDWPGIIALIGTCDESKLPYTLLDMAKDVIGLMDALQVNKAHIVGASMGGAIAQLIAIHYPDRILSLTSMMSSSGNPKSVPGDPEVLKLMGTPPPQTNNQDSLVSYLVNIYKAMGGPAHPTPDNKLKDMARKSVQRSWYPMGSARQAAAVIIGDNCDRRALLKNIKVPTVVVHGESDPVVNVEAGRELARAIPNSKFISIAGMGHDLPETLTSQFANAIITAATKK
ncbi:alpha/beta fold hydrolase [Arcticibacter sp.]|uniref:alpha/beta fold hydrolase n=1 Tax=Arcticibacter sp. TaxID=1872630 RepID=UPI00388FB471